MGVLCTDSLPAVHIVSDDIRWTLLKTTSLKKILKKIDKYIFVLKHITIQRKQNKRQLMKTYAVAGPTVPYNKVQI